MVYRISTMNTRFTQHCDALECQKASANDLAVMRYVSADEELAGLVKALGHPVRVQIARLLIAHTKCICGELCEEIPLAQSTISQHLKLLKQTGLIIGEVDGVRRGYYYHRTTDTVKNWSSQRCNSMMRV